MLDRCDQCEWWNRHKPPLVPGPQATHGSCFKFPSTEYKYEDERCSFFAKAGVHRALKLDLDGGS